MKHILLILSIVCMASLGSFAQTATTDTQTYNFTVADCVNYAYAHQDSVVNAGLDVKSAQFHVKETIGQGLPQINGTGNFLDYIKIPVTLVPGQFFGQPAGTFVPLKFGVTYQSSLSATGSQILFDPAYFVGLAGRRTYQDLYDKSLVRTRITTNVNVTKAYYQVLVSIEQLRITQQDIDQLKKQVDETVAQNKQGVAEKIDVDRITVQYNSLLTKKDNTVRSLELNYEMLKYQMGMPIEDNLLLKDKLENIQLDMNIDASIPDTAVYHHRVEYGLLETQEKLDEYDVKLKKGQFLPKLTANANYTASFQNNSFGNLYSSNYPSSYIGLTLNFPIFTGLQHVNQLRQSQITVEKARNNMFATRNALSLEVSRARGTYLNGLETLTDQKRNRALALEVLRVAKIKYQQGVGSSLEVIQAQTALQDADNTYIQGLYDALISKVDLDKAYGRIQ